MMAEKDEDTAIQPSAFILQPSAFRSFEHRHRCAIPTLILPARPPRFHGRMFSQVLAHGLPQSAGSEAVNDAHGRLPFEQRAIEKAIRRFDGIVNTLTNEVELRADLGRL